MNINDKISALSVNAKKNLIRKMYSQDIDKYMSNLVYTLDEHDTTGIPFKKFPYNEWQYLKELIHTFEDNQYVLVWKSRQIMATWTAMAYALFVAMFREGKKIAIQSKKSDDADALIQRIKVIYDKLPGWKPEAFFSYCRVKIPSVGSDIFGVPQGAEQLRSYTFSVIISDEYGFQEETAETFGAAKPIVDGGGKFIAITTPPREKNFSYNCLRNPIFKVYRAHYSKRPDRDEAWKKKAQIGISKEDWDRENELQITQTGVSRVLSAFNDRLHINPTLLYHRDWLTCRIWDFGYHRPCCTFAQINDMDQINVLKVILGRDVYIDEFAERVLRFTEVHFPGASPLDFGDYAGHQKSDKSPKTSIDIVRDKIGAHIKSRKTINIEDDLNIFRKKLATIIGDRPALQFHPDCLYLIDGLTFGYVYGKNGETIISDGINEAGEDERGYFGHGIDTVRYLLTNLYTNKGSRFPTDLKTSAIQRTQLATKVGLNATVSQLSTKSIFR
jgi:hypothetical protein